MKNFYVLILCFIIGIFSLKDIKAKDANTNANTSEAKDKILKEFREKLLNEQEIKKELEKNVTLTNEDFDVLINKNDKTTIKDVLNSIKETDEEKQRKEEEKAKKKEEERIKNERKKQVEAEEKKIKIEQEKIRKEEERIRKEEERIKKEEKKNLKIKQTEKEKEKKIKEKEEFENRKKELNKKKKELEKNNENITKLKESINSIGSSISDNIKNVSKNFDSLTTDTQQTSDKPGVLVKLYNITDTGVSEEFLYSKKYQELISNKTDIKKVDINKETDIPVLYVEEKNIVNFSTSDIPEELLTYKRSEENKHIPTIILNKDLQNIAMRAIEQNNLSVLRGVIEQTKDPDFFVDKNRTLLSFAIENQKYILVRYLIYSGASINKTDNKLNNPLHISILNHNEEIVNLLIENGVDIDAQNIDGNTPIMLSISTNQDNIALILLKNGANLKLKNNVGDTAVDVCTKNGKTKIRQYIRDIMKEEENL